MRTDTERLDWMRDHYASFDGLVHRGGNRPPHRHSCSIKWRITNEEWFRETWCDGWSTSAVHLDDPDIGALWRAAIDRAMAAHDHAVATLTKPPVESCYVEETDSIAELAPLSPQEEPKDGRND